MTYIVVGKIYICPPEEFAKCAICEMHNIPCREKTMMKKTLKKDGQKRLPRKKITDKSLLADVQEMKAVNNNNNMSKTNSVSENSVSDHDANRQTSIVDTEKKLRLHMQALDYAASSIVITDPDGMIQWVNNAFTKFTGYSKSEAIGYNPRILKSGYHDASFYKEMWDSITSGKTWHGEMHNRRKDGTIYIEEMTIAPVYDEGKITNFVAIKQDITERKLQEELIAKKTAELETFNRLTIDREIKMTELKKEITRLKRALMEREAIIR